MAACEKLANSRKRLKSPALLDMSLLLLIFLIVANAGQLCAYQQRVITCMLPLEHADAKKPADILAPFLSPQGRIAAYLPTNTLIIKDQPPVVQMLIKVIKGRSDLSGCQNSEHVTEGNNKIP